VGGWVLEVAIDLERDWFVQLQTAAGESRKCSVLCLVLSKIGSGYLLLKLGKASVASACTRPRVFIQETENKIWRSDLERLCNEQHSCLSLYRLFFRAKVKIG